MKRKLTCWIALTLSMLVLVSCSSGKESCASLMEQICLLFPDLPGSETVYTTAGEGAKTISEQDAAHIYVGDYGTLAEWSLIEDYAIRLPDQPQIYEIHVLKVKNASDSETIAKLLCQRADLLAKYFADPAKTGDYDYSSYRADVYKKDQYVFLIATPNNASVIALIEERL